MTIEELKEEIKILKEDIKLLWCIIQYGIFPYTDNDISYNRWIEKCRKEIIKK